MIAIVLFKAALAVYLVSAAVYIASLLVRRVLLARVATGLILAALIIHTLSFAAWWLTAEMGPVIRFRETLSMFAWVMAIAYLALQLKTKTRVLGAFISPVICLFMMVASVGLGGTVAAPAMLGRTLVTFHVMLSVAGEALFAVASCAGLMYLFQDGLLRKKKAGGFSKLLPSLGDLDRINHLCLLWGFPLLTLGGLVMAVEAAASTGGNHWQWDPKQIWMLLAWGFYAFLLHQRLAIGWRGRTAARWSLAAFVILLVLLMVGMPFFRTFHDFL